MGFEDSLQRMFNAGPDRWVATGNTPAEGGVLVQRGLSGNYSTGAGGVGEAHSVLAGQNPYGGWVSIPQPGEDLGSLSRNLTSQYNSPLAIQGVVPSGIVANPSASALELPRAMMPSEITGVGSMIPQGSNQLDWARNYLQLQQETGISPEAGTRGAQFNEDLRGALATGRYEVDESMGERYLANADEVEGNLRRTLDRYSAEGPPRVEGPALPDPRASAHRTDDGVGPRPVDAPQDPRAQDPRHLPTTTAGDAGGGGGGGGCTTCGAAPAAAPGGGSGDAPVAAGDAPPADAPPPPPPRPADADDAFRRAQRAPGSSADGSVYGVGGTTDSPQFYRFSQDGTYQGTVERIPTEAQMGVSDQMIRMEHPDAPMRRMVTGPEGQRYGVGPEGVAVEEGNGFRTLTPEERASLPRNVQNQLMVRAAGPTLATPDGQNAIFQARARTAGSVIDWAQNVNDAQAAGLAIGSDNVGRRMDSRRR